jgi:hypothetical protein
VAFVSVYEWKMGVVVVVVVVVEMVVAIVVVVVVAVRHEAVSMIGLMV